MVLSGIAKLSATNGLKGVWMWDFLLDEVGSLFYWLTLSLFYCFEIVKIDVIVRRRVYKFKPIDHELV